MPRASRRAGDAGGDRGAQRCRRRRLPQTATGALIAGWQVADDLEVLEVVVEDDAGSRRMTSRGSGQRGARELQVDLLEVVEVEVAVAAGPDELAEAEVALLRHHVREQRVRRDVERHAEEDVALRW